MKVRPSYIKSVGAAFLALALLVMGSGASRAAPPTDDPALAAEYGAGWLATQIQPDGSLPGGFDPLGDAGSAALALAASGVAGDAFDRAVGYVEDNVDDFVAYPFDPTIDDPGRLAKAIMIADLAGLDPSSFGGTDLVARLDATLGLFEPGLYGDNDPSFDGVFRQGLAITALLGAGEMVDAAAIDWLVDQQCATPASTTGAWEDYRADPTQPCAPADPVTFAGPDTNSTALAVMALEAVDSVYLDPTGYLDAAQDDDGGWPFLAGSGTDPSSTSLVIRALVALGEDPSDWTQPGGDPWTALLSFQQGCDADAVDRGAFTSTFADPPGTPDVFSSIDGVAGAAGQPYPLVGPVSLDPDAPEVDCTPDEPTTTTTAPPGGPSAPGAAAVNATTPAATPVGATPGFTG